MLFLPKAPDELTSTAVLQSCSKGYTKLTIRNQRNLRPDNASLLFIDDRDPRAAGCEQTTRR